MVRRCHQHMPPLEGLVRPPQADIVSDCRRCAAVGVACVAAGAATCAWQVCT